MLRLTRWFLQWAAGFVLLAWALHLKDPHLLSVRPYETPALVSLCLLLALTFLRQRPLIRAAGLTLLLATSALALWKELDYRQQKIQLLSAQHPASAVLGSHLLVGYESLDELYNLARQGLIGGIFVTRRNLDGKSLQQLREDISELQRLRQEAGLAPLLVATDQEGGLVSHLSPPLQKRPALASLDSGTSEDDIREQARRYGAAQGAELTELGINLNFSPVVDLKQQHEDNPLDFHSRINQRAISAAPQRTTMIASAYSQGLESQGVLPTLKHFPGFAGVTGDTHHFATSLQTPLAQLERRDWLPFRQVSASSHALIMLGHVVLSELDPDNLVSSSAKVIQGVLRQSWQHQGVLITDDLSMAAAYNRGLCNVAVKGLNAGVDLLLVSYDHEKVYPLLDCLSRAWQHGELDQAQLQQSAQRLGALHHWLAQRPAPQK